PGAGLGKAGRSGVRWAQPSTPDVGVSVTMRWGNESTLWGTESVLSGNLSMCSGFEVLAGAGKVRIREIKSCLGGVKVQFTCQVLLVVEYHFVMYVGHSRFVRTRTKAKVELHRNQPECTQTYARSASVIDITI
ncbi:MAG: hypothetical protein ABJZ91_01830, partial [Cyclobacteriaceae bacterium]